MWYRFNKETEYFEDGGSLDGLSAHSQLLFKSMNDISKDLRVELERTENIDNRLVETITCNKEGIKTFKQG